MEVEQPSELWCLVYLYRLWNDRAEWAYEAWQEAHFEGDTMRNDIASDRYHTANRKSFALAKQIRAQEPAFKFMFAESWLHEHK